MLKWLSNEEKGKVHVMKICNIPRKATDVMVTKMLQRKIKDLKYEKIIVEMDNKSSLNKGIAWVSSKDIFTLNQLIKLHYHVSYNRNSLFYFYFHLDLRKLQVNHLHLRICIR